jgi:hypothetical protein
LASLWKVPIRQTCSCISNQLGDLVKVVYYYIEKESKKYCKNYLRIISYIR